MIPPVVKEETLIYIEYFWQAVLEQNEDKIRTYFHPQAYVNWHCTNEQFSVEEFIYVNCKYPGDWDGNVEKVIVKDEITITVTHVYSKDRQLSFHVTSFFRIKDNKIISVDEYWADDGDAPKWRKDMHIGKHIR